MGVQAATENSASHRICCAMRWQLAVLAVVSWPMIVARVLIILHVPGIIGAKQHGSRRRYPPNDAQVVQEGIFQQ